MPFELHLDRDGTTLSHRIGPAGCTIGRGPSNDLVVSDPQVSQSHARLWVEDEVLWVRDLGSSNGTFVDDVRLDVPRAVGPLAELRVGATRVVIHAADRSDGTRVALVVQDVATGVCVALASDRVTIGGDLESDLCVPGLSARAATLVVHAGDEVWLGTPTDERELAIGETFEVEGRQFTVHPGSDLRGATQMPKEPPRAYAIHARLDGPTGPEATVTDLRLGTSHTVQADHRAVLLYLLARQHAHDAALGDRLPERERGWCTNDHVMTGIWGRAQSRENTLHVLVHRLRRELEDAGLDPWFIEKRRGFVRARLVEAVVV